MKKFLFLVLASLALTACQESMEQRAVRDAQEVTQKKCPMPLDPEGRVVLEGITFDPETHVWCQDFLLMVDSGQVFIEGQVKDLLVDELKNTPSYKPYMDHGFSFQYVYRNKENPTDTVINLTLTAADYQEKR